MEGVGQEKEVDGPGSGDTLVTLQGVLILLRGMLAEPDTHMATIDDLKSTPTSIRISLALTSNGFVHCMHIWDPPPLCLKSLTPHFCCRGTSWQGGHSIGGGLEERDSST